ncbi:MAG: nitrogen fixation protein NifH [Dehalococcoidia bacterium]|nr:nitrogen fixation protein NifH [Dehalococcoidia bacterium]
MTAIEQAPAWTRLLNDNPLPWLLDDEAPAVKHLALLRLLDRTEGDTEVQLAAAQAMQRDPIASILAAQQPEGYWVKPGPGYAPKYRATVWQLIFLDQLGADRHDPRVRAACEYVLVHAQAESGGFAASGSKSEGKPPPSGVIHCLNGNLLRALLDFGYLNDERVQHAIDWQARSITGEGMEHYYASGTSGPGFGCAANEKLPCAWGAIKALLALARVPFEHREPHVRRAVRQGADFLLSRDPAAADYPMGWGNTRPNGSWFKLGFPSGYVADVLQNLEVLCELGFAGDLRLKPALDWVLSRQDRQGRWRNEYAYNGKTWIDFEKQGQPSRWVTLRACHVIKMAMEAGGDALPAGNQRGSAA